MRRPTPACWSEYDYFRRRTGLTAVQCLALVRAEQFARNANLELQHELGASYLHERRWTDEPGAETHWADRNWEYSEPLIVMPRPRDIPDRVIAAILAARLISESRRSEAQTSRT